MKNLFLLLMLVISFQDLTADTIQTDNVVETVNLLDTKVDILVETNTKLLNSVYWTLGTMGLIFALILSANAFLNFKINSQKIEELKMNLHIELKESASKIKQEIDNKLPLIVSSKISQVELKYKELEQEFLLLKREYLKKEYLKENWSHYEKFGNLMSLLDCDIMIMKNQSFYDFYLNGTIDTIKEYIKSNKESLSTEDKINIKRKFESIKGEKYEKIISEILRELHKE